MGKRINRISEKEKGASEITLFITFIFLNFTVLAVALVITAINYNTFVDKILAEITNRVKKEATVYKIDSYEELQQIFQEVKVEYGDYFVKFYKNNILPTKFRTAIIDNIELKCLAIDQNNNTFVRNGQYGDNLLYNNMYYTIELNIDSKNVTLPLIFFEYMPKKLRYLIIPINNDI